MLHHPGSSSRCSRAPTVRTSPSYGRATRAAQWPRLPASRRCVSSNRPSQPPDISFCKWFKSVFVDRTRPVYTDRASDSQPARLELGTLRRLVSLAKPEKKLIGVATLALAVNSAANMTVPAGMGQILDSTNFAMQADLMLLLAGALGLGSVALFTRLTLFRIITERISMRLREQLFGSIVRQEIAFFDQNRTGELINRLSADIGTVSAALTDNISMGFKTVMEGLVGISLAFYLAPQLALVMGYTIPPLVLGSLVYGRYVRFLSREVQQALSKTTELAEEKISSMRTVRAFSQEEREIEAYQESVQHVFWLAKKQGQVSGAFYAAMSLITNLSLLGVLGYGGALIMAHEMTVGQLASFMFYSLYCVGALYGAAGLYGDLMKALGASSRVFELLDRLPRIPLRGGKVIASLKGDIDFRDVSFKYPTRPEQDVLKEFNLKLEAGKVVAIVGASGSGKSTVAQLIERFYTPTNGKILVDGEDITELDPTWLRDQIGFVSQEPVLFATSIGENIRYGKPSATQDEIEAVARLANAHDFITSFPEKYGTMVGERGALLSGGQKQRVAIARAFLRNPRILLLDEATSALDAASEVAIQEALQRLMRGRTTLVIAHRLSTIKKADVIAVIADGHIAEQGSYDQLTALNGLFAKLVKSQLQWHEQHHPASPVFV